MLERLAELRLAIAAAAALFAALWIAEFHPVWTGAGLVLVLAAALAGRRADTRRRSGVRDREREERARAESAGAVIEALADPALLIGQDGIVLGGNAASRGLVGALSGGEHLSARLRYPDLLDMVAEALQDGAPAEIELTERGSGRIYLARIAPVVVPAHDAGPVMLLVFREITEARRMDRMRSDFVANASHELRTPLASLTGFIETLLGPAREDPVARERFLGIMLEQANRMTRLIDDLMSLSRIEMKAHVVPSAAVDLGALLAHAADTLRPLAADLGVDLALDLPEAPVLIAGDRDELLQVFDNLIENACKYGQAGKRIEIALSDAPARPEDMAAMVDVSVRDFGPGIAPEHVPRLTERFYRVDVESSRAKKGTGLGLAIVKHILTRHRARLIVSSELGRGSVFTARFPRLGTIQQSLKKT